MAASRRSASKSRGGDASNRRERLTFWFLAGFLALLAFTGGGSRGDILSLIVLRPVSVVLCAVAAWTIAPEAWRRGRAALVLLAAVFVLTVLHLIPLPPSLWQALPGRDLVAAIDREAGLGAVWRPISLAPMETRNALFSLFVPLAVLLLGVQLGRQALHRLLWVVLAIALFSGILALLQLLGPPTGPLFFYRHTNYGAATGIFANRNHQAIFLAAALPMLAAAVTAHARREHGVRVMVAALATAVFLVPLLLVVGSRAGMLLGVLSLTSLALVLRIDSGRTGRAGRGGALLRRLTGPRVLVVGGGVLLAALVVVTVLAARAESFSRLLQLSAADELRFKVWPVIVQATGTYFPVGAGIGAFAPVFQTVEPDAILRPTYLNHAHNEVLEIVLTAGLPGALLLAGAVAVWIVGAVRAVRRPMVMRSDAGGHDVLFARLGLIVLLVLALGSLGDYPMRTPFLAALAALAALWAGRIDRRSAK